VKLARILVGLLAVPLWAADARLDGLLKLIETRYNHAQTLEVLFREEYTPPARMPRVESGRLQLRKPGRMRWEYSQPQGKLFVSDGKSLWLYTPDEHRAEKMKLKESEDMRAPLAFLLGRLDFSKEFRNIAARAEGALTRITADPQTDNLPYSAVEFVVSSEGQIREVKVTGYDKSLLRFAFDQEKLGLPLDQKLFRFDLPKGAGVVEAE
jgi:outer membrane lipoprotein carrier protein